MPDFTRAEISTHAQDLTPYLTFLRRLSPGNVVTLPLEPGESRRRVMRTLNSAAGQVKVRLSRVDAPEGTVRFRVLPPEKRAITMSEEARRARVEKARATRAARRRNELSPAVDAARSDEAPADETTGMEADTPPITTEEASRAFEELMRLEAAEGAEQPEQPDTTQIEAPEETPEAAAPSGRSPRTRRRTSPTAGR